MRDNKGGCLLFWPDRTVIGSSRDEIIQGNYNSWHYSGLTPGYITLVGGCGDGHLLGGEGTDHLYGNLPEEMVNDEVARKVNGNVSGYTGNDYWVGSWNGGR